MKPTNGWDMVTAHLPRGAYLYTPRRVRRSEAEAMRAYHLEHNVYSTEPLHDRLELLRVFERVFARALRPHEEEIIRARYFEEKTLDEVAEERGVSRQRISQIEQKVLQRLRLHASVLRVFDPLDDMDVSARKAPKRRAG